MSRIHDDNPRHEPTDTAAEKTDHVAPAEAQPEGETAAAARLIQRNYRGYRERRQLRGMGLDASSRWAEAVKEAKWRNITRVLSESNSSRDPTPTTPLSPAESSQAGSEAARQKWKRVGEIARRAGADDPDEPSQSEDQLDDEERRARRARKDELRAEREKTAKMMDLQYFLEMVDQKHRYGSNLRAYHDHWKNTDTHENFFYWLDYGDGSTYEHPTVPRERLDAEQVRYLSREERMQYLVQIDGEGRLCWAKNGERINTTPEYKDSMNGIVPKDDTTPAFTDGGRYHEARKRRGSASSSDSSSSSDSEHSDVEGEHYVNNDLQNAKGLAKIKYVSAAAVLNHLLRGSVKPNSWIFVADTSFRLYIGIKQSGAFQHSSFLHGARISAAGLIKIKDGQLRRLSPLSGHYRPPTKNFRAFVHSLQHSGADMSRVSISRSYAVLVGLEVYVKTRRKVKKGAQIVSNTETRIMRPEEYKRMKDAQIDGSKSAQRERQLLAARAEEEDKERREKSWRRKLWRRIRGASLGEDGGAAAAAASGAAGKRGDPLSKEGQDVESGIAPSGKRDRLGGG